MEELILWAGFIGGWLLFAGPIYQASVELGEQQIERDAIGAKFRTVEQTRRSSPWWWLLPPVGYVLQRRQSDEHHKRAFEALSPQHREQFVRYSQKATGWAYVAGGALFIATKETWELFEHHEWPWWLFCTVVVVMAALAGLNTAVRGQRAHQLLG